MKKLGLLLVLMVLPVIAQAADQPLMSLARLSTAAGVNHVWNESNDTTVLAAFPNEFSLGLYAAYNLTSSPMPHLSLTGSTEYGLDSKLISAKVGLRMRLWQGGQ